MTYELVFDDKALREWRRLNATVREQMKKKLLRRLEDPEVEVDKLSGMAGCYKIKRAGDGYRLIYRAIDNQLQVVVVAVGKRERVAVYDQAKKRLE